MADGNDPDASAPGGPARFARHGTRPVGRAPGTPALGTGEAGPERPDDPRGCAGCGRLPEQVEAVAGPTAGPSLCVDCVDRARSALTAEAGTCVLCERRTGASRAGARLGEPEIVVCAACLDGLAALMAEPD